MDRSIEKQNYKSKAITKTITAASSATINMSGNYYKFSYMEERQIPEDANIDIERNLLWETCNSEIDNQIILLQKIYNNVD